jgi:hypothetical protein
MKIIRSLTLVLPLVAVPAAANAGVVMEMEVRDASTQETTTSRTYVENRYIKSEVRTKNAGKYGRAINEDGDMIYNPPGAPAGERMIMVNHGEKSYQVVDQAMIDKLSGMMGGAGGGGMNAMIANAMKDLPPEDRARAMAAMQQYGGGGMPGMPRQPKRDVRRTGGSDTVNGIPCTIWEQTEDGVRSGELCVAKTSAIKHGDEIMPAFRSMTDFMSKLFDSMPMMRDVADSSLAVYDKIDGVPVRMRDYSNGKLQSETIFKGASVQSMSKDFFGPPAGYKRTEMMPQ